MVVFQVKLLSSIQDGFKLNSRGDYLTEKRGDG